MLDATSSGIRSLLRATATDIRVSEAKCEVACRGSPRVSQRSPGATMPRTDE
jgi:hypothetical protein